MGKFNILLVLVLSGLLMACDEEGGGVIVTQDPPPANVGTPQEHNPEDHVGDTEPVPGPSPYNPPYSAADLRLKIVNALPGSVLELDRDVNLNSAVDLDKNLTITSATSLGRRAKITVINTSAVFNVMHNDITLSNLEFDVTNSTNFISSQVVSGVSVYENLTINNSLIKLRGQSSLRTTMDGAVLNRNTILGLALARQSSLSLVELTGNNLTIISNTIIDVNNSYRNSLSLIRNQGILVQDNVMRCFCAPFYGVISGDQIQAAVIHSNILHDKNSTRSNTEFGVGDVGSIGISFRNSSNLTDNGFTNYYAATMFRLDDEDDGGSTNINLTPGLVVSEFSASNLFNYLPSEDFTPLCHPSNPTLSATAKATWSSYSIPIPTLNPYFNGTLYYSGALRPACN